jgi:raffinose/stachyose/melibiose transport system permease protein
MNQNGKAVIVKVIVNIFRYALLIVLGFITIFPLIWMLYSSFKTNPEFSRSVIALPESLRFENYINAWKTAHIGTYFFNSIFVSVLSIVLTVVIGASAAFVLAKFVFPGKGIIRSLFIAGMLIPLQAVFVPLYTIMRDIHVYNTPWALILVYTAFGLPLTIFLMESFIASFPDSIMEAAIIDGSTMPRIFFSIILPMTRPVVATVAIVNFLTNWKEFGFALVFISSESKKTLPSGLYNFLGAYTTDYTGLMAALVIATLPLFILYIILQEQIINGMTAGAVKG